MSLDRNPFESNYLCDGQIAASGFEAPGGTPRPPQAPMASCAFPKPLTPRKETAAMPIVVGRPSKSSCRSIPRPCSDSTAPESGPSRTTLTVRIGEQTLTTDIASKAVRKAQAVIREADCFAMLQGKLIRDRIEECSLVAQPKQPKG